MNVEQVRIELIKNFSIIQEKVFALQEQKIRVYMGRKIAIVLIMAACIVSMIFGKDSSILRIACAVAVLLLGGFMVYTALPRQIRCILPMPENMVSDKALISRYLAEGKILDYDRFVINLPNGEVGFIIKVLYVEHQKSLYVIDATGSEIAVEKSQDDKVRFARKGENISLVMLPESFFAEKQPAV